jgi:hypothetical protein
MYKITHDIFSNITFKKLAGSLFFNHSHFIYLLQLIREMELIDKKRSRELEQMMAEDKRRREQS